MKQSEWQLLENGHVIGWFTSHKKAKNAMHWKIKEADDDMLDLYYELRRVEK